MSSIVLPGVENVDSVLPLEAASSLPAPSVSSTEPDWSREHRRSFSWTPSRALIASVRRYQAARAKGGLLALVSRRWAVLRHRWWSAVTGADLPLTTEMGGGLLLPHPNGVVVHPAVRLGPNCIVFQQVTLGMRRGGVPRIGGAVEIGAGAKVLGAITVGDHAVIGANAVVLHDVPAGATVVGAPARVVPRRAV